MVLIKFTPGGQMTGFHAYGGGQADTTDRYNCWPNAIKTDANGNSYIYGWTGPGNLYGSFLLESPYNYNFSLMKINSSGIVQWAKIIKEKQYGWHSMQIDLDGDGNCYIGGNFRDTIYFENNMVVNQGKSDLFLAKYGNTGNFIWAKVFSSNPSGQAGNPNPNNYLYVITVYDTASLFIAGNTCYEIQFDDIILHSSSSNGFIALLGSEIPVGIQAPQKVGTGLSIYPNPADDYIYIACNGQTRYENTVTSIEIISMSGQIFSHKEFSSASNNLFSMFMIFRPECILSD